IAPVKAELRDFQGLDHKPSRAKEVVALILIVAAVAGAAHAFYFGVPHAQEVAIQAAGDGVQRITVTTGGSAVVVVTGDWVAARESRLPRLLQALRAKQVKKAVLMLPNGSSAGVLDLTPAKPSGTSPPTAAAK